MASKRKHEPDPNIAARMRAWFKQQAEKGKTPKLNRHVNSPYVQDTLYAVAGGAPGAVRESDRANAVIAMLGNVPAHKVEGFTADLNGVPPIVNIGSWSDPQRVLDHEMGHIADNRGKFPNVREAAEVTAKQSQGYSATNPTENFAEALRLAMNVIRAKSPLTFQAELHTASQVNPLVSVMVPTLLNEPVFSQHPARTWGNASRMRSHPTP